MSRVPIEQLAQNIGLGPGPPTGVQFHLHLRRLHAVQSKRPNPSAAQSPMSSAAAEHGNGTFLQVAHPTSNRWRNFAAHVARYQNSVLISEKKMQFHMRDPQPVRGIREPALVPGQSCDPYHMLSCRVSFFLAQLVQTVSVSASSTSAIILRRRRQSKLQWVWILTTWSSPRCFESAAAPWHLLNWRLACFSAVA